MELNFKADEFLNLSPAERVEICRLMAIEAVSLSAGNGSPELRKAYADLATRWSLLADEIARYIGGSQYGQITNLACPWRRTIASARLGVILSGTATDGTFGQEALKAECGITFVHDQSARYNSMSLSAFAAGCVDFVLPPENIAKELARTPISLRNGSQARSLTEERPIRVRF